jgi:hypothetical protein
MQNTKTFKEYICLYPLIFTRIFVISKRVLLLFNVKLIYKR